VKDKVFEVEICGIAGEFIAPTAKTARMKAVSQWWDARGESRVKRRWPTPIKVQLKRIEL